MLGCYILAIIYDHEMRISVKKAYELILTAVHVDGTLMEPFTAKDIRRIISGWHYTDYFGFLAYNSDYNKSEEDALFIRVGRGSYRLRSHLAFTEAD
ncbi:hypothetical protein QBD00_002924 [Ochrobactrum sp. AN78]|nr:hypothetical protein [Ochrobactrum sp. AN78]